MSSSETPPAPDVARLIERLQEMRAWFATNLDNVDDFRDLIGETANALAALQARETALREEVSDTASAAVKYQNELRRELLGKLEQAEADAASRAIIIGKMEMRYEALRQAQARLVAIIQERHYLGAPLKTGSYLRDITVAMVRADWHTRLLASVVPASGA